MNYEDKDLNVVIISGKINVITDTNDKYIKFGITANKYTTKENRNVYVSLNISRELYYIYKDYIVKDNKIYIKGYLNSYIDKNKTIKSFITVIDVASNRKEILYGKKAPHIREDDEGVLIWNGKRCDDTPATEEEILEMEKLLKEYQ